MGINSGEIIIDHSTPFDLLFKPIVDGEKKGRGLLPRDYWKDPSEMFEPPSAMKVIPRNEWSSRIKEMEETKSRISDVLRDQNIPSMDQGNVGYCWAHSTAACIQTIRALNQQKYVALSAYMVASIIKKGRDEGGWCGLSAKFLRETGICSQELWPQGNRDYRRLDTTEVRTNAALHKVTEEWVDVTRPVYDTEMTFDQVVTCLLLRIPVAGDFNWWGHSVLLCDPVEVEPGDYGIRERNSWGDGWGDKGFSVLRGSRAVPDSAVALRVAGASPI